MSFAVKLRRGEGPFWGPLKRVARALLRFHLPVVAVTRPFFGLLYRLHVFLREGGLWLLRVLWFEPLFRSQCESVGSGFQMEKLPYINGRGRIVLGDNVFLAGKSTLVFGNRRHELPELIVGDDTFIGHDCVLAAAQSVRIGKHCLLASEVRISDFDGHPVDAARRRAKEPTPPDAVKSVRIGDDVWLGTGAVILKGVTVGDRSIVGAYAVVTKDVPPDAIVAGNPARIVKHLSSTGDA